MNLEKDGNAAAWDSEEGDKKSEDLKFDENSELSCAIHEDSYFKNSSLFLFHIDSPLRKFCLSLAEPRDAVEEVYRIRDRTPDYMIRLPLLDGHDVDSN